jgi:hypothetical protein
VARMRSVGRGRKRLLLGVDRKRRSEGQTDENDPNQTPLTAKLNKLTIKVDRPQLSPEDIKKLQAAMREKAKSD